MKGLINLLPERKPTPKKIGRAKRIIEVDGIKYTIDEFAEKHKLKPATLRRRMYVNKLSPEDAVKPHAVMTSSQAGRLGAKSGKNLNWTIRRN